MLNALEEVGVKELTLLLNRIYETGDIPPDLTKSVFITLPKKPGATECESHRTISLMSHITKILLRVLIMRVRKKIKPEIAQEQCGFVEGKGTTNAIYMLRTICERALEIQKDVYLCFIDYTKAFDRVRHESIMQLLESIGIDGKDLRIIKNMYWEQTAAVRLKNETSSYQNIKRGVRQGCVLSPDLFSLYIEYIMRSIKDKSGLQVGGHVINNIRYADDTVLIAENERDLQALLNIIVKESEEMGLSLNEKKTETMVVTRQRTVPTCSLKIGNCELRQVEKFKYLGAMITTNGKCDTEIKARIGQAKQTFQKMRHILTNSKLAFQVRERVLRCYVHPILMYGSEAWTMSKQVEKRITASEMWFIRRMLRVSWMAKKTNESVLKEAEIELSLLNRIRSQQANFVGHAMRRHSLEHIITTGKMNGKRSRGRQREKIWDGLGRWTGGDRAIDLIVKSEDREKWRDMVTNANWHGTT